MPYFAGIVCCKDLQFSCRLCVLYAFLRYSLVRPAVHRLLQAGLENDEQRVGADIIRRALPYALKLIARNAGVNGSVVVQKV